MGLKGFDGCVEGVMDMHGYALPRYGEATQDANENTVAPKAKAMGAAAGR
jgi:hypothetical protein